MAEEKTEGLGGKAIALGKDAMDFIEGIVGSDVMDMGMDWWKSEQGKKQIKDWNDHAKALAKTRNDLKETWVKKSRGYDTSVDGDRSGYFYNPAVVVASGDGTFGVDKNGDGTVNETFATQEEAQARVGEIKGTSSFESYGGEGLYSREVEDVVLANQNQIRKVVQQLQSPADRKKLLDTIAKFADLQALHTSDFITSALIDEDIVEDGKTTESLSKSRTNLINNLNAILGDTAEAINLADSIGTGEINKADFRRAVDVGDALKDQAEAVSDQEYYRAMAVVAANEEKYELLEASAKEAKLDIYNDLQAERYKGGFQGLSSRHTRDLAREFLANNTVLAKELANINIENAKLMGDAHVRRARLTGEADVKSAELEGVANTRGAERSRQSEVNQANNTGKAETAGATNLIKDKDYITDLRNKMKFEGYQQEIYEMDRISERDKALASGVETEQKMLADYRIGVANFGDPVVAKQMHAPEFDWISSLLDKITKSDGTGEGDESLITSLLAGLSGGFEGIKNALGFGEKEEALVTYTTNSDGSLTGSDGTVISGGGFVNEEYGPNQPGSNSGNQVIQNPVLPVGTILDDDGNGIDDRTDLNGDGVIDRLDTLYYEEDSGKYYNLDNLGGRFYQDGTYAGTDEGGNLLTNTVPGTVPNQADDTYSIAGEYDAGFFGPEAPEDTNVVPPTKSPIYTPNEGPPLTDEEKAAALAGIDRDETTGEIGGAAAGVSGVDPVGSLGAAYGLSESQSIEAGLGESPAKGQFRFDAGPPPGFVYVDENGNTGNKLSKEEMEDRGLLEGALDTLSESELALYETATGDFLMSDEDLGLGDYVPVDFDALGLDNELQQSNNFLSESEGLGLTQVDLGAGSSMAALQNSGGVGAINNNFNNAGSNDNLGQLGIDQGYGLDEYGQTVTHDDYTFGLGDGLDLPTFELGGIK